MKRVVCGGGCVERAAGRGVKRGSVWRGLWGHGLERDWGKGRGAVGKGEGGCGEMDWRGTGEKEGGCGKRDARRGMKRGLWEKGCTEGDEKGTVGKGMHGGG